MNEPCKTLPIAFIRVTLLTLLLLSQHASADPLADLIRGVGAAIIRANNQQAEEAQQLELDKRPKSATNTLQDQSVNNGRSIESAAQYCEEVESSQLIREFATQLSRTRAIRRWGSWGKSDFSDLREQAFDNSARQLTTWVYEQVEKKGPCFGTNCERRCVDEVICRQRAETILRWAGYCAAKHIDDELFMFFVADLDKVDVEKVNARSPGYIASASEGGFLATLMAISLPNGLNMLESTGRENLEALRAHIDKVIQKQEKDDKADAEWAQKKEEEKKAEQEKQKFANSPAGKLSAAYRLMASIDQCVEIREGYAFVYINDIQHTKAKKLIRRIETALKDKLQGTTTDELWNKAASGVNVQAAFIAARLLGFDEAQVCRSYIHDLEAVGERVWGKKAPEKSW